MFSIRFRFFSKLQSLQVMVERDGKPPAQECAKLCEEAIELKL